MENIYVVLSVIILILFGVFGVGLTIYAYIPIIKRKKRTVKIKVQGVEPTIKEALNILKEETNDNKLARAFIELMQTSYVLVHVIVNKGNNYKDNVQCKAFCDFLTSEVVDKMKSLEGEDGKRTF